MRQYKPMLADDAEAPFSSPDWIFEAKWDGIRAISYIGEEISIRSRNGRELTGRFPELQELLDLARDVVLDGEIVVMEEGRVNFQAAAKRSQTTGQLEIEHLRRKLPATYIVFDILERDGDPLTETPLLERKRILGDSLKEGRHVVLSAYVEEYGEDYYRAAIQRGLEGVIAKRKGSRYEQGRSSSWLKVKRVRTCDCTVFGYTSGKGSREKTFGALILGLYDEGEPVYVGKVGTGFSQKDLETLREAFNGIEAEEETLPGVEIPDQITWLRPVLVCEVGYHSVTDDMRLRMPRFLDLRTNKDPMECSMEQIHSESLGEYAAKRDFTVTPEPPGGGIKPLGSIFVVQEHCSRRLHYDLRLERDGVLKSWAVPKEPPKRPGVRRLAVQVEDHDIDYIDFEGTIPEGEYGAGTVKIWDRGTFEVESRKPDKLVFHLHGEKMKGRHTLIHFTDKPENWLLFKTKSG